MLRKNSAISALGQTDKNIYGPLNGLPIKLAFCHPLYQTAILISRQQKANLIKQ